MTRTPRITDHAVLRYLERGWGVDVAALKRRVAAQVPCAEVSVEALGDCAVIRDGLRFHLRRTKDGTVTIVTITSAQEGHISNRADRLRARHGRRMCK